MRKKLRELEGERLRFRATVDRFGQKNGWRGSLETILLKNVALLTENIEFSGQIVTDHIWFAKGKSWQACKENSIVEFDARIAPYLKGYMGHREDVYSPPKLNYKLERPTKINILHN